jgi:hypothetical protein
MIISELIIYLQKTLAEHGDLKIMYQDHTSIYLDLEKRDISIENSLDTDNEKRVIIG